MTYAVVMAKSSTGLATAGPHWHGGTPSEQAGTGSAQDALHRNPEQTRDLCGGQAMLSDGGAADGPPVSRRLGGSTTCGTGEGMTQLADRITVNPKQCGGRPCVRGMRIRVSDVLELLASGMTPRQILAEHPDLKLEDIRACLRFASSRVDHPVIAA